MDRIIRALLGGGEEGEGKGRLRRRLRRRIAEGSEGGERWRRVVKWTLGLALLFFATLLFPSRRAYRYNLQEGDVTPEAIVSPITFSIYKSEEELTRQREDARMSVPPVLEFQTDHQQRQRALLDSLFLTLGEVRTRSDDDSAAVKEFQRVAPEVSEEALLYLFGAETRNRPLARRQTLSRERVGALRQALDDVVTGYFSLGVVTSLSDLRSIGRTTVAVDNGAEERVQGIDTLLDLAEARSGLPGRLRERLTEADERLIKGGYELGRLVLVPNLVLDTQRTALRRQDAANNVALFKGTVLRDEEIIGAHKRVTHDVLEKITALERALADQEREQGLWPPIRNLLARLVLVALLIAVYVAFLRFHRPTILADNRTLATLVLVVAVELLLAFLIRQAGTLSDYLVPVAIATMLLTVLFDTGVGLVTAFTIGLLLGAIMGFDYTIALVHTAAGAAGVFAVRKVARRSNFYRALWVIPLVYLAAIGSIEALRLQPLYEVLGSVGYGVANGLLSVVVTIGMLPIFESLFRLTTDISLLELSDLNHPLLRQLAMRAPGTYQHSLVMGELGATAAESCGANPLLTRVGAYFHDIGKMNKPEYFVENQAGRNPHSKLNPRMSALIVASHVKEGIELAEQHRLPDKVKAFIPEHHGEMTMTFFYVKAVEQADGEKVEEHDFKYPGPKPQSRETAIVMLADAVEAASRVLQDPSPSRIRGLVHDLVTTRFTEGELDECPLTMRDLRNVEDAFTTVLTSRFHQRIDYPDKEESLRKVAEREATARRKVQEDLEGGEGALPAGFDEALPAGSARPLDEEESP
jgi:putative nucleotidyltransferase with HDIG domain